MFQTQVLQKEMITARRRPNATKQCARMSNIRVKRTKTVQLPCHSSMMNGKTIWQQIFQFQVLLQRTRKQVATVKYMN